MPEDVSPAAPAPAENREGTGRGDDGRFAAGKSGNPHGRPKGLALFREKCQSKSDVLLTKLLTIALKGNGMQAVRAAEVVLAYGWGKPNQPITGDGGKDLIPTRDDALEALRRAMPAAAAAAVEAINSGSNAEG